VKNIITLLTLFSALLLFSCSTATTATKSNDKVSVETSSQHYVSLADYLRRNSNVSVKGTGQDIRLQIRGMNSLTSDTRPYIYINRNPIGREYVKADNAVDPNNIKRIEVISSLAELTIYGQEGHSGIIKIHTKSK